MTPELYSRLKFPELHSCRLSKTYLAILSQPSPKSNPNSNLEVPPTRSGFPDFGPDPDFFDQTGPDLVRNLVRSPDFSKNCQTNA